MCSITSSVPEKRPAAWSLATSTRCCSTKGWPAVTHCSWNASSDIRSYLIFPRVAQRVTPFYELAPENAWWDHPIGGKRTRCPLPLRVACREHSCCDRCKENHLALRRRRAHTARKDKSAMKASMFDQRHSPTLSVHEGYTAWAVTYDEMK